MGKLLDLVIGKKGDSYGKSAPLRKGKGIPCAKCGDMVDPKSAVYSSKNPMCEECAEEAPAKKGGKK